MNPQAGFQKQGEALLGLAQGLPPLLPVAIGLRMQSVQVPVIEPLLLLVLHARRSLSTNNNNKKAVQCLGIASHMSQADVARLKS